MKLNYETLNLFHKYLYNRVNYKKFKSILQRGLGINPLSDDYLNSKWKQFQKCPIQFIASCGEYTFNAVLKDMIDENYKG